MCVVVNLSFLLHTESHLAPGCWESKSKNVPIETNQSERNHLLHPRSSCLQSDTMCSQRSYKICTLLFFCSNIPHLSKKQEHMCRLECKQEIKSMKLSENTCLAHTTCENPKVCLVNAVKWCMYEWSLSVDCGVRSVESLLVHDQ